MKQILLITVFALATLLSYGQEHHPKFEKIKALKTAHITNALNLTKQEAEKFWPTYNASEEKILELRKKSKKIRKKAMENFETLSENDAKKIVNESITLENQLLGEKEKMFKSVMRILSAKKVIQLQKAEHEFKRKLLRRMKGKRKPHNKKEEQ